MKASNTSAKIVLLADISPLPSLISSANFRSDAKRASEF